MELSERLMGLKVESKCSYAELERASGVKSYVISEIARGIRSKDSSKKVDFYSLVYLAHAFDMTVMRFLEPCEDWMDNNVIDSMTRKISGQLVRTKTEYV